MKKIILTLIISTILLSPIGVLALDGTTPPTEGGVESLPVLVALIKTAVWIIFGLLAVVMFVVAGVLFLTAGGAPEKVATARSAAMYGVAGVAIGVLAWSILSIVGSVFGA